MNYPNKSKKEYNKFTSYANRGMNLEELLNQSNEYYLLEDKAIIYKKPTPITISEVNMVRKKELLPKLIFVRHQL